MLGQSNVFQFTTCTRFLLELSFTIYIYIYLNEQLIRTKITEIDGRVERADFSPIFISKLAGNQRNSIDIERNGSPPGKS